MFTPRFDIWENDEELVLCGDLPGVTSENLDIQFENGELMIHGHVSPRQGNLQYLCGEYGVGDFYRSFAVGESIEVDRIAADLKNGVLTLHLPKTEDVKPRRIKVAAA
jgi:HSP20 family protein